MILGVLRCALFGRTGTEKAQFRSKDLVASTQAMTWPLVIPKNADEPTATTVFLQFCQ